MKKLLLSFLVLFLGKIVFAQTVVVLDLPQPCEGYEIQENESVVSTFVVDVYLLPDNWSTSVYSFNEPNVYDAAFNSNVISSDTWLLLEGNGAVFLPIAGERNFTSVNTNNGAYWSSQAGVEALYLAIDNYGTGVNGMSRYRGLSVRLVRNVE